MRRFVARWTEFRLYGERIRFSRQTIRNNPDFNSPSGGAEYKS